MRQFLIVFAFALIPVVSLMGQNRDLPTIELKDLEGNSVSTSTFDNEGKPIVISFWATWCKPCIAELNTILEDYADWQDETGVKIIAISIDDARNSPKVKPAVMARGWEYEVYIDENADFKRAMSVNQIPHTFVLDKDKKVVWQHNGYTSGDEDTLLEVIEAVAKGEDPEGH